MSDPNMADQPNENQSHNPDKTLVEGKNPETAKDSPVPQTASERLERQRLIRRQREINEMRRMEEEMQALRRLPTDAELLEAQRRVRLQRRHKARLFWGRIMLFVLMPAVATFIYLSTMATRFYAADSAVIVLSGESGGAPSLPGLLGGAALPTLKETLAVRHFLLSEEVMQRIDREHQFLAHYRDRTIDPLSRLGGLQLYRNELEYYQDKVQVVLDPLEGIIKLRVIARTPEAALAFSNALLGYSEQMINDLSKRMRRDHLAIAAEELKAAEERLFASRREMAQLQAKSGEIDPIATIQGISTVIVGLETELAKIDTQIDSQQALGTSGRVSEARALRQALVAQIAQQRKRLIEVRGERSFTETLAAFEKAKTNLEISQQIWAKAVDAYDRSRITANQQVRFLSTVIQPTTSAIPVRPRPLHDAAMVLILALVGYSILSLFYRAISEQARQ